MIKKYSTWAHKKKGTTYLVLNVSNTAATREGWDVTVVYTDGKEDWSSSPEEFMGRMKHISDTPDVNLMAAVTRTALLSFVLASQSEGRGSIKEDILGIIKDKLDSSED